MSPAGQSQPTQGVSKKSKWRSSLAWIAIIWLLPRLFSELHPVSWERMFFWNALSLFGTLPATAFLVLAIATTTTILQNGFRWAALLMVVGSFSGLLAIGEGWALNQLFVQAIAFTVIAPGIWLYAWRKRSR